MRSTLQDLRTGDSVGIAALIGSLLVLPFIVMQLTVGRNASSDFPVFLFVFLWVLPTVFIATLAPVLRRLVGGEGLFEKPVDLILRAVLLLAIATLWFSVVNDQMPCFLGVPNCD